MSEIKINLGSHNKKIGEEYINIDVLDLPNVDAQCNLEIIPFRLLVKHQNKFGDEWDLFEEDEPCTTIKNNFIDEIVMEEVLEHISFRLTVPILTEIHRILKPGGQLSIQVPDCGKSMEYFVNGNICTCCAHKPKSEEDAKAIPNCPNCQGKGKIHPDRWLFSFLGAQKHPFDSHLNIFTKNRLETSLTQSGFKNIEIKNDKYGWKLKAKCIK